MGLQLYYRRNDEFVAISQNGIMSSPLATVHDGKTGDMYVTQLYLRNDNPLVWFSNIEVFPFDKNAGEILKGDVNYQDTGWGIKLSLSSSEPTQGMWEDIEWGESVLIDKVGDSGNPDTAKYHPFWYMITCPPNHDAAIKENITFRVEYTENVV